MSLFISDDRGVTEPYTDLPAIGLVSIGIVLFGYLLVSAYFTYASAAYLVAEQDALRVVALSLASDQAIAADGLSGVMDAKKLGDQRSFTGATGRYGHPGSSLVVTIEAGSHCWKAGVQGQGRSASYRLPICVVLNDVSTMPGFLTVTSWERA